MESGSGFVVVDEVNRRCEVFRIRAEDLGEGCFKSGRANVLIDGPQLLA